MHFQSTVFCGLSVISFCLFVLYHRKWLNRKRSNQSVLKKINPEYSLEGLMLKLKLQYFGHLMGSANSFEKTLMLGIGCRQEEKRRTEDEMVGWHQ